MCIKPDHLPGWCHISTREHTGEGHSRIRHPSGTKDLNMPQKLQKINQSKTANKAFLAAVGKRILPEFIRVMKVSNNFKQTFYKEASKGKKGMKISRIVLVRHGLISTEVFTK